MAPTLRPLEKISSEPIRSKSKPPTQPPAQISPSVCFSLAAYAKTVIHHLRSQNLDVSPGLTDREISAIESSLSFSFPPDLRSILQAGLPVGTHFPNWRAGSTQHLRVLLNLPAFHLSKNVSRNGFWVGAWGPKPKNDVLASSLVKKLLEHAPILVPVYGNCYVPSSVPNMAGNPVFQVDGDGVRVLSFDIIGFFDRFDRFSKMGDFNAGGFTYLTGKKKRIPSAWAAMEARKIEFWTDVAESGRRMTARGPTRGWWSALGDGGLCMRLRASLDYTFWMLRDGGWDEDEVREMMNGQDESSCGAHACSTVDNAALQQVSRRITSISKILSRGGWSREDVVYSLDLGEDIESNGCDHEDVHRDSCTEVRKISPASHENSEGGHQTRGAVTTLMHLLSLEA